MSTGAVVSVIVAAVVVAAMARICASRETVLADR